MTIRIQLTIVPLVALLTVATVLFTAGAGGAAPSLDAKEQALLEIVNEYRQENGLGSLVPSAGLNASSDWFANDMASKNYFPVDHIDSLGRNPTQRGEAFGYPWGVAENIGAGAILSDPQAIFDAWRGSPGHNANMLGTGYDMIGIGLVSRSDGYGWYWVLDLGTVLTAAVPDLSPTPTTSAAPKPAPSATPGPTASPAPTATPEPTPLAIRGDANCDLSVGSTDALTILRSEAGYDVDGACLDNGNVDCDEDRDVLDALAILKWVVSQPISISDSCPPIGAVL